MNKQVNWTRGQVSISRCSDFSFAYNQIGYLNDNFWNKDNKNKVTSANVAIHKKVTCKINVQSAAHVQGLQKKW